MFRQQAKPRGGVAKISSVGEKLFVTGRVRYARLAQLVEQPVYTGKVGGSSPSARTMSSKDFLPFALQLARDSGGIMKQNFILGMKKEWKADHSSLTETDMAIHRLVEASIKRDFPDHGILSEEGESYQGDAEYIWVCDPVDGTHNFSHGIPTATFMLSLVHNGEPILGVIYDPFMDRLFHAEKGKGAFMNDKPIHVSSSSECKRTVIGIGKTTGVVGLYPIMEHLRSKEVRIISGLSIGYMGALVAAGEFAATLFGGRDPHDTVAIQILVEEAGGKATNLFGKKSERYDGNVDGQLASNGILHEELLKIISDHGKK